jgi:arylsulfatase A-like enzyme
VRRRGFGAGFDEYTENRGEQMKAPGEVRLTFGQAGRWIEANRALPFFLFVHTYEVHSPYDPEPPYADLFRDDSAPGPAKPAIRAARDGYDREIRAVDDELRALFATLEGAGLANSTVAVILSDHGEEFAEHGGFQHGGAVYDESLRVPLLFWGPGRIPAARRHGAPVSLIDVAPTLLDLAGLSVPEGLDGISLKPLLVDGASLPDRPLVAEAQTTMRWLDPLEQEAWNPPLFAVRTGHSKFIVHRPAVGEAQPMLRFDLAADPDERTPLPVAAEQARAVDAWIAPHLAGTQPAVARPADPELDVSPDLLERLRALGYAE